MPESAIQRAVLVNNRSAKILVVQSKQGHNYSKQVAQSRYQCTEHCFTMIMLVKLQRHTRIHHQEGQVE